MEQKTIKTKIIKYKINLNDDGAIKEYGKVCELAKQHTKQTKPFTTHYINFSYDHREKDKYDAKIKTLEYVNIETKFLFSNQLNASEGLRLFFWHEYRYENPKIKEGYYLELTEEFFNLLNKTVRCGYCGKQYINKKGFCTACLNSEYLTKDQLFLLRLKPICDESNRQQLTEEEKSDIMPLYNRGQFEGKNSRAQIEFRNLKKRYQEDRKKANIEYKGFNWLLNNKVDLQYIKNCIYYSHTGIFTFGWREPLSFDNEQTLKGQLENFKFNFEIKVK